MAPTSWKFFAGKDISATPAISLLGALVYFPSWNGHIYAINAITGTSVWDKNLGELTGLSGTGVVFNVNVSVSRATPTIAGELLILGIYGPAIVIAVNQFTGQLVWKRQLDDRPRALITTSGTVLNGYFYVGVSSLEEALSPEKCCTFRGSMVKLNVQTGEIVWQTYTVQDNGGKRGAPPEVLKCQEEENKHKGPPHPDRCINPDNHYNSILAFDTETGKIRWSKQLGGYDIWYLACLNPASPDGPPGPNIDADFGECPMLLSINVNGKLRDVVVAAQKSGFVWALDRSNGDIIWSTVAGPGGNEGGGTWGASTDGRMVYTNIVNSDRVQFQLAPTKQTTTAGAWVALDANNGNIVWSTANLSNDTSNGPVTLVNGVLFAGSVAPYCPIYAMDAQTGKILLSFDTGATVYGGVSASNGCIYFGNGYTVSFAKFKPTWTPGTSLFAFCVDLLP
ncbi:hypothetical protein IFM89_018442 [Coptis chinensis]|uniref:Pyrrolo-quinoline quinone repeat domain-containing protein n=1 Tax=Coptis chinensis TaxID=261450 RepID=A0A835HU39_9MAGN|nr:hypothetical protein IFM89_018442 [Coptis chinensis]